MNKVSSSIVFRLTFWFLLLALLPLWVMAFFVRGSLVTAFERNAIQIRADQVAANADVLAQWRDDFGQARQYVQITQPEGGEHFLMDADGRILAHADPAQVGHSARARYSAQVWQQLLSQPAGSLVDRRRQSVLAYARIRDTDWVDVVEVPLQIELSLTDDLTRIAALQLALSLLMVGLAGWLALWQTVGAPLRKLTRAARQLGLSDAPLSLEPDEMQDELRVLADTVLQTDEQVRGLVRGLEHQVSELDKAYTSLRQSEERVRTIFDSVNDVILVVDARTGAILEANQKFSEIFGYSRADWGQLRLFDLAAREMPYSYREGLRMLRRARQDGPQMFEWRLRSQDGRSFWADANFRLATLDGQERALITLRDIDQRRRAERTQVATYRILQAALAAGTLYEYFALTHEVLQGVLPASNFTAVFCDTSCAEFKFPYHLDAHQPWPLMDGANDQALIQFVLNQGEPALLTPDSARALQLELPPLALDWLAAPLKTSRGVLGLLIIRNYEQDQRLTENDCETFALLTAQIALAVERKLAQDALRQSEARWRTLMESAPQLIMTLDRQGQITFINHPLEGVDVPLQVGSSLAIILPDSSPEAYRALLEKVFSARQPLEFEFSLPGARARRWYSCAITPVVDAGWVETALLNAADITRLKETETALRASEEMYRAIVEQLTDGFSLLDQRGKILEWNRAMQTITGIPREEAIGKLVWQVQARLASTTATSQDARRYRRILQALIDSQSAPPTRSSYQTVIRSLEGHFVSVQQTFFPIRTETHARLGTLVRDITVERQAQEQIRRLNEELEQRVVERTMELEAANRELEAFSYSISHDLRAPLRAIDGFARLLSEELDSNHPGESLRFLEVIRQNAQQMGRLIDDLLAFSRLGRQNVNLQPVETLALIQQALQTLEVEHLSPPVELSIQPDLLNADGDPGLLQQVWINLLSNAIKFSRHRHPAQIEISSQKAPGETIFIVRDNGVGFDMRYADKLFGVFQRLHRAEEFEGTGVGLAIANRIVRRHGGRIWAESQPGQGAVFFFSLPGA